MGEFMIECTLCGVSFGSEKLYDGHPCMDDDVKVPFKIKMEPDDEEAELEEEVQKVLDQAAKSCKEELISNVKEEPVDVDFEDVDPLGITEEEVGPLSSRGVVASVSTATTSSQNDEVDEEAENNTKGATLNECLVCGKRFFRREDFLNHKMNAHKVPRPYECKVCEKRFTQKHYVSLHMRVHTGERPYKCTICSNTYTHKTSFTIHMRIHNGDRPYRCGICGKRCYDKSGLTSHMRSHTKETPYECEMCGRRFTHSKSLLVHRRNHTGEKPYVCKYCGKCFRHWHKHKIHVRLHTGERPYKCKICGKGFPRNDEVKRHMRSHQGIKSFKCSICSVYCATQASITGHIDLHHSDLKPDNPSAPEKTVVRNSVCGILGTKAPQPRTVYKPIAPLPEGEEENPQDTERRSAIVAGKKGSDGKAKLLSYKEYMDFQEKRLTDRGLVIKDSKGSSKSSVKAVDGSKKVSSVAQSRSAPSEQGAATNIGNGKQIMVLAPQNVQSGGNNVFILSNQKMANPAQTIQSVTPTAPTTGQQLILGSPSVVLPQPQAQQLIQPQAQQLILLSPSGFQQNSIGSSPMLLLSAPGSNGQRLILLPKPTTTQTQGNQLMILPSNASGGTTASCSNVVVKQEVMDNNSSAVLADVPVTRIKEEPVDQVISGVVIKQEPQEVDSVPSSSFMNITIKQEPQDTE